MNHTRPSGRGKKCYCFKIGRDETTQLKWGRKYLMFDVKTATLSLNEENLQTILEYDGLTVCLSQ